MNLGQLGGNTRVFFIQDGFALSTRFSAVTYILLIGVVRIGALW